jgi:hypothetical protein
VSVVLIVHAGIQAKSRIAPFQIVRFIPSGLAEESRMLSYGPRLYGITVFGAWLDTNPKFVNAFQFTARFSHLE